MTDESNRAKRLEGRGRQLAAVRELANLSPETFGLLRERLDNLDRARRNLDYYVSMLDDLIGEVEDERA